MNGVTKDNCCVCGISIYIDDDYRNTLRNNHKSFYCINGHSQLFNSKSDVEIQKEINKSLVETFNKKEKELKEQIMEIAKFPFRCHLCVHKYTSKGNLNVHLNKYHKLKLNRK